MSIIDKVCKSVLEQSQIRVDDWLKSNGVTIENIKKYKLRMNFGRPEFTTIEKDGGMYIQGTTNTRYDLYPARGRNAKKIISSLYI